MEGVLPHAELKLMHEVWREQLVEVVAKLCEQFREGALQKQVSWYEGEAKIPTLTRTG